MITINFACKRMPINRILRCSFGVSKTEIDIIMMLIREGKQLDTLAIMKKIGKDKTTIQRAMKSLSEKELVHRKQINLDKGGYVYNYHAVSKKHIKERIYESFDNFKKSIENEIERW